MVLRKKSSIAAVINQPYFLPLVLVVSGSLLLAGMAGVWLFRRQGSQPGTIPLPVTIANQRKVSIQTGARAIEEFSRLHGESFPITAGAVGDYGTDQKVTLWVAGTKNENTAAQLVALMEEKIALGTSPFQPEDEFQKSGRTIYALTGMGQKHYYFQSGERVIWMAADKSISEQALDEILIFYP